MNDIAIRHGAMPPGQCPDVVFATPSLMHAVAKRYLRSMVQTTWLLKGLGLTAGHMDRDGDCFVAKARNKLVGDFLEQFPATENFFFVDDDIAWPPHKVIEFLNRPEDVVAGVYPKKCDETDFPVSLITENGALVERDGLVLAQLAPTGFMRIKRRVLEKLVQSVPRFTDMEPDGTEASYPVIFESGPGHDGKWWGEDYTFCMKWRALGGQVWVDPDIKFEHQGLKTWANDLADNMDVFRQKAKEHFERKKALQLSDSEALAAAIEKELANS